jgi:hypothetical protein
MTNMNAESVQIKITLPEQALTSVKELCQAKGIALEDFVKLAFGLADLAYNLSSFDSLAIVGEDGEVKYVIDLK